MRKRERNSGPIANPYPYSTLGGECKWIPRTRDLGLAFRSSESFIDEPGSKKRFKYAYHRKLKRELNEVSYEHGGPTPACLQNIVACTSACSQMDTSINNFSTEAESLLFNEDTIIGEASTELKNSMEHLSMGVFLAEIGDIKTLFNLIKRGSSTLQNIANAHLNYSFGWRPFINDLNDIWKFAFKFRKQLNDLKSKNLQPKTFRYMVKNSGRFSKTNNYSWGVNSSFCTINTVQNVTISYRFNLPDLDNYLNIVKAFFDYYGLRPSLALAWELVPFSFVVDWFVGVGRFLQQFDKPLLDLGIEIIDCCVSRKVTWELTQNFEYYPAYPGDSIWVFKEKGEEYIRRPVLPLMPNYYGVRWSNGYGYSQMLLSASLLITRRR